jgi:hypothetical protein
MKANVLLNAEGQIVNALYQFILPIIAISLMAFQVHPLPVELPNALAMQPEAFSKLVFFHLPYDHNTPDIYRAIRPGEAVSFLSGEIRVHLLNDRRTAAPLSLGIRFAGSNHAVRLEGDQLLPGLLNLYEGHNSKMWAQGLSTYAQVVYRQLYPGIEARFDGSQGLLKGTYLLSPGADPRQLRWSYEGVGQVQVNTESGALELTLPDGRRLVEQKPVAWQDINGRRVNVDVRYQWDPTAHTAGFALHGLTRAYPLTIDPTLDFSTYFGGDSDEWANSVRTDAAGNVYIAGYTASTDLPGPGSSPAQDIDVFVTCFNSSGSQVLYTTLLGGNGLDEALALAVSSSGTAWISGDTASNDFPLKNAFQTSLADEQDAFIARLNSSGGLEFSSYAGGQGADAGRSLALDTQGNAYVAGQIANYIVLRVKAGSNPDPFGLYINGLQNAQLNVTGIALDQSADVYVTGSVTSDAFPVANPVQAQCGAFSQYECSQDAFILETDANFSQLLFSTYLGGSASNGGAGDDEGRAIAVDPGGQNIYVGGVTSTGDFPVKNAIQAQKKGANNIESGFLTHLIRQGNGYAVDYSTYLGGTRWSEVNALTVDGSGGLYATGFTEASDFPTQSALQSALVDAICIAGTERHCYDAFITQLGPQGSLVFSTYWGGGSDDVGRSVTLTPAGNVLVAGYTASFDFYTSAHAYQAEKNAKDDAFLLQIQPSDVVPPASYNYWSYLPITVR